MPNKTLDELWKRNPTNQIRRKLVCFSRTGLAKMLLAAICRVTYLHMHVTLTLAEPHHAEVHRRNQQSNDATNYKGLTQEKPFKAEKLPITPLFFRAKSQTGNNSELSCKVHNKGHVGNDNFGLPFGSLERRYHCLLYGSSVSSVFFFILSQRTSAQSVQCHAFSN